jgi:hypothetical protein
LLWTSKDRVSLCSFLCSLIRTLLLGFRLVHECVLSVYKGFGVLHKCFILLLYFLVQAYFNNALIFRGSMLKFAYMGRECYRKYLNRECPSFNRILTSSKSSTDWTFRAKPLVWNECVSKGCCLKCWIVLFNWQVLRRTFAACWCCYLLPTFATYQSFHGQLNLAEPEV